MSKHQFDVPDFKDTIDFDKVLKKDEHEQRYDKIMTKRRKQRKRKKRIRWFSGVTIIMLVGLYLLTSYSNIKIIKVKNNVIYSEQQILDKSGVHYQSKLVLHPWFWVEYQLKQDDLIKNATVSKNYWNGSIYIEVEEEKVIGHYQEGNKDYVLLANGKSVIMEANSITLLASPLLVGLDEKQRQMLSEYLAPIDEEYIYLISEIHPFATSYDNNMLELFMEDGHIIRTSYKRLDRLSVYKKVLERIQGNARCLYTIDALDTMDSESCD